MANLEFTETHEKIIAAACGMYSTAALLQNANMTTDANAVAAKAKSLMNKALEGIVETPSTD